MKEELGGKIMAKVMTVVKIKIMAVVNIKK